MKNMGLHYLNSGITAFDVTKPSILVYSRRDGKYQLGALERVLLPAPRLTASRSPRAGRRSSFGTRIS
jgi:hypothetical protein